MTTQPISYEGAQSEEEPKGLHKPCLLGMLKVCTDENGYITPAFSEWWAGNQNGCATPHLLGSKESRET